MMALQENVRDIQNLQDVLELLASGKLSEDEGRRIFEELWDKAEQDSLLRRILRELFPSLSRSST